MPTKLDALRIIANKSPITATEFAELMWPDSEGWNRVKNCGNGATRGRGMVLAGGSYLAKLKKQGLIWRADIGTWELSTEGKKWLADQAALSS